MKEIKFIIILLLFSLFHLSLFSDSFEDLGFGARASSLGIGYIALSDDTSAIYYNPAGIARQKNNTASITFTIPYLGLGSGNPVDENNSLYNISIAYIHILKILGLGIGYNRFGLFNYYSEDSLLISSAKNFQFKNLNLNTGLNLKFLSKSYGKDIYTEANEIFSTGYRKNGFSVDFGILYSGEPFSIGLSAIDIFSTDMGLKEKEQLEKKFNFGISYTFSEKTLREIPGCYAGTALMGLKFSNESLKYSIGAEFFFLKNKALGIRINYQPTSFGIGAGYTKDISKKYNLEINYNFEYPLGGIFATYGTHRISLNFNFGER